MGFVLSLPAELFPPYPPSLTSPPTHPSWPGSNMSWGGTRLLRLLLQGKGDEGPRGVRLLFVVAVVIIVVIAVHLSLFPSYFPCCPHPRDRKKLALKVRVRKKKKLKKVQEFKLE